jgi:hypothetical protein
MHRGRLAIAIPIALALVSLSVALVTHAESVLWSRSFDSNLYSVDYLLGGDDELYFRDPAVTVHYRAHMENEDTGALIPSGATILTGSRVRFVFERHAYTDISWFATGGTFDSPYGDWSADAAAPPIACNSKDFVGKDNTDQKYQGDIYASLVVNAPLKMLSGVDAFDCEAPAVDGTQICTASAPGTFNPLFTFGGALTVDVPRFSGGNAIAPQAMNLSGTYGYFYPRFKTTDGRCFGSNFAMTPTEESDNQGTGRAFVVNVPVRTIPMTLSVVPAPENAEVHAPTTPSLQSGGACVVGQPHTITFVSTDPDNENLRYAIDWDADGSIDQWVPQSGYVPSGNIQSAARTYSIAGEKTLKVMAQDESGLTSGWATLSFDCTDSVTAGLDTDGQIGSVGGAGPFLPPSADLDIRAIPSLLRQGNTTLVNWSAEDVESCTVQGDNGDNWSGTKSPVGGETSSPITGETTYTLSCLDADGTPHTKQATVRIIPTFQEL